MFHCPEAVELESVPRMQFFCPVWSILMAVAVMAAVLPTGCTTLLC